MINKTASLYIDENVNIYVEYSDNLYTCQINNDGSTIAKLGIDEMKEIADMFAKIIYELGR